MRLSAASTTGRVPCITSPRRWLYSEPCSKASIKLIPPGIDLVLHLDVETAMFPLICLSLAHPVSAFF